MSTKKEEWQDQLKTILISIPDMIKNFVISEKISKNTKLGVFIMICLVLLSFNGINILGFLQSYLGKVMSWTSFVVIVIGIYLFLKSKYDGHIKQMEKELIRYKNKSSSK